MNSRGPMIVAAAAAVGVASLASGGAAASTGAMAAALSSHVWGTAEQVPGTAALNQGGTPESPRCRVPRRATAARAGTTKKAPATTRRSWPAR